VKKPWLEDCTIKGKNHFLTPPANVKVERKKRSESTLTLAGRWENVILFL